VKEVVESPRRNEMMLERWDN